MNAAHLSMARLESLRVADVMARGVVSVSACQSIVSAAREMSQNQVSATPVVDERGRCVGMLSATDFMRHTAQACSAEPLMAAQGDLGGLESVPFDRLCRESDLVRDYMTPAVQGVDAHAPLLQAARMMCAAHLHRMPVLDEHGRPAGIVSSLDIVAALVKSVDEQTQHERVR